MHVANQEKLDTTNESDREALLYQSTVLQNTNKKKRNRVLPRQISVTLQTSSGVTDTVGYELCTDAFNRHS